MRLRKGKAERQRVVAVRQVRQEQGATYDDLGNIARNKRRAAQLRNTPAARAARGE